MSKAAAESMIISTFRVLDGWHLVNTMIGLATPPYGLLLFVVTSITRSPIRDTIRHLLPFLAIMVAGLAIITFLPELVLWLPRLYGYNG